MTRHEWIFSDPPRFVAATKARNIKLQRLRALPDELNEDTRVLIEVCGISHDLGEEVRLCLASVQKARLAAQKEESHDQDFGQLVASLDNPIPQGSFWSLYRPDAPLAAATIGVMDYNMDKTFKGVTVYADTPPVGLQAYAGFWRRVFTDAEQSVSLQDWRHLYD